MLPVMKRVTDVSDNGQARPFRWGAVCRALAERSHRFQNRLAVGDNFEDGPRNSNANCTEQGEGLCSKGVLAAGKSESVLNKWRRMRGGSSMSH